MFSLKTSATTHAASLIIKQTLPPSLFLFQLAQTQTKTLVYEEEKSRSRGNVEIIMFLEEVVVVGSEVEREVVVA